MYEQIVIKSNENISNITTFAKDIQSDCLAVNKGRVIIEKKYFITQAKTFAELIIRDYVFFLVSLYIYECDFEFTNNNRHYIVGKVIENLKKHAEAPNSVKDKLVYFAENFRIISIDGFMRFSMREYDDAILNLADVFIDEILYGP